MRNGKTHHWWEAQYCSGVNPGTGKLIRKTITGATSFDVAQKLRVVTVSVDDNSYVEPNKMPLKKWCDIWLDDYTSDLKYLTKKLIKLRLKIISSPALVQRP
ncbi:putative site-specific recombinase [Oscillibacter valericigenes Sjm18-20]|nr:putative site-specific recombinase [Oscillibacter valericigenes Sjm18-20]